MPLALLANDLRDALDAAEQRAEQLEKALRHIVDSEEFDVTYSHYTVADAREALRLHEQGEKS